MRATPPVSSTTSTAAIRIPYFELSLRYPRGTLRVVMKTDSYLLFFIDKIESEGVD